MSLDRFYNKFGILQSSARNLGQTLANEDLTSISYETAVLENVQDDFLNLEAHFYNKQGEYLTSQYTIPYKFSPEYKDFLFDIPHLFNQSNLLYGSYKISFAFLIDLFGSIDNAPFFVDTISPDRTELKLRVKLSYVSSYPDVVQELQVFRDIAATLKANNRLNNVAVNFGSNNIFQIVNVKVECNDTGNINPCQSSDEQNCNELLVYFKLQYPLIPFIQEKQFCFISFKVLEDYVDTFTLKPSEDQPDYKRLRGPKFDSCTTIETSNSTDLRSWNELLDTDAITSNSIIREVLSGSEQIPLNIDYSSFSNFVKYGSATERVKNYNYKRQLLEFYDLQSKNALLSNASASIYVAKLTDNYLRRSDLLLTEFDEFEKYLHYNTGSVFSYDISGSVSPAPKKIEQSRLYNYPTTSSQYTQWYDNVLGKASAFDFRNYDSFYYNTPDHILRDPNNSEYITFLHMMGQHFDTIYTYVRELTAIHKRDEHPERGIPNKLLPYYARSLGWKIQNTKQLSDLWLYKLGVDQSGSYLVPSGSLVSKAHENLNHQVWRRVVNNLPSLLKTKGSERSIRALFSIYGIPFTLISVKEYGGPSLESVTLDTTPNIAQDRFHYLLNFKGDQYIELPRNLVSSSVNSYTQVPSTVEFRFKTNYTGSVSMSLWAIEENSNRSNVLHNLELVHSSASFYGVNTYGYLKYTAASGSAGNLVYKTVTGSLLPYFDNDAWTVRIFSEKEIRPSGSFDSILKIESGKASDFVDSRVSLSSSISIFGSYPDSMLYSLGATNLSNTSSHYIVLGGTTGSYSVRFSGSIHGYKEYFTSYSKDVFLEHILNPGSYHTNYYTGSYKELYRYYPLGLDNLRFDHSTYSQVSSSHPNRVISVGTTASFYNFTGAQNEQYSSDTELYYQYIPTIGANVPRSNKIRIEKSTLTNTLSPSERSEVSNFDRSTRDSNRLAIVFSPTDQINRDIANQFGPYNFENFIGDPGDGPKTYYPDLDKARDEYFKKFAKANDIGKYIEIFSLYDYTVFSQLKQLVPARANLIAGILVEPSLLERPKHRRTFPKITIIGEQGIIDTAITQISSSYIPPYPGVIPFPFIPEIERAKEETVLPIKWIPDADRQKHITTIVSPLVPEVSRDKEKTILTASIGISLERSKYAAEIAKITNINSLYVNDSLNGNIPASEYKLQAIHSDLQTKLLIKDELLKLSTEFTTYQSVLNLQLSEEKLVGNYQGSIQSDVNTVATYGSTINLSKLNLQDVEVHPGVVGYTVNRISNTFQYTSNGLTKTITVVDDKLQSLTGVYSIRSRKSTLVRDYSKKTGSFKVKLTGTSTYVSFYQSQLLSNSYEFEFTTVDIFNTTTLLGPKFKQFLESYKYSVYDLDLNIYNLEPFLPLEHVVVTGSVFTPGYSKFETYYSSSGLFIPGVTSPLMLTSPVYLSNSTSSFKSKYQRELDYSTNKRIGAYYSSSLKPINYQHFEDSRIGGMRFRGSKIQGPDINQNSSATINGTPVVIVTLIEDNPIRI